MPNLSVTTSRYQYHLSYLCRIGHEIAYQGVSVSYSYQSINQSILSCDPDTIQNCGCTNKLRIEILYLYIEG